MYTLIVLLWLSTIFGGEGPGPNGHPPGRGRPMKVTVEFPTKAACDKLTRELKTFEHEVVLSCSTAQAAK